MTDKQVIVMTLDNETYLKSLQLPAPVRQRIDDVLSAFRFLAGDEIEHIFVSTKEVQPSGELKYDSLWGFIGPHWLEARDFLNQYDFDIASYQQGIYYIGLQCVKVSFPGGVTDESRISVEVQTGKVEYSKMSAVGGNCGRLLEVTEKILRPNLV